MFADSEQLDLLLLSEEYVEYSSQDFRNIIALESRIKEQPPSYTHAVKEKLERMYGVKDFFQPSPSSPFSEQAKPTDNYEIKLPHRPSLALCNLATVVKAAGYSVCIIDNFMRWPWRYQQLQDIIRNHSPRLIGITTTFLLNPEVIEGIVQSLRDLTEEAKIVLGGPTVRNKKQLHGCADFSVFGSGEQPILEILEVLDGKREASSIANIAFIDPEGNLQYGSGAREAALVDKLGVPYSSRADDAIPIPDWSLYNRSRQSVYCIEFSRGCKYNCYYCSYERGKTIRDLEEIKSELIANAALGITKYWIVDSNFTDGPPRYNEYPLDICQLMIDLDLGLQWSCYSRVDDLNDELAGKMKQAGCFAVTFGIESGDDRILKLMRKGHNVADAFQGIETAKRNGLFIYANFVIGYPGETKESYMNTIEFIERSRPDSVSFQKLFLDPRSPVYGKMNDFDINGSGLEWRHKTMDSEEAANLADEAMNHLLSRNISIGNGYEVPALMSAGFSVDEIKKVINSRKYKDYRTSEPRKPRGKAPSWLRRMAREVASDQKSMASGNFKTSSANPLLSHKL